jgi:hypothetical protein
MLMESGYSVEWILEIIMIMVIDSGSQIIWAG